ncbi:hypothetical protein BDV12DRAFT_193289 [Aspergillus spectabilis]
MAMSSDRPTRKIHHGSTLLALVSQPLLQQMQTSGGQLHPLTSYLSARMMKREGCRCGVGAAELTGGAAFGQMWH